MRREIAEENLELVLQTPGTIPLPARPPVVAAD